MVEVIIRKWGNSLGAVLPKDFVEQHNLKESDKIRIEVARLTGGDVAGILKGKIGMSAQEFKDMVREGWDE